MELREALEIAIDDIQKTSRVIKKDPWMKAQLLQAKNTLEALLTQIKTEEEEKAKQGCLHL